MDVWKFVNYSDTAPVFALSLTAKQWGLAPFPANVIAISGSWQNLQSTNATNASVSKLPYDCNSSSSEYSDSYVHSYTADDSNQYTFNDSLTDIALNSTLCSRISRKHPCNDSCTILIEHAFRTTTGPAYAPIVSLTHGISFLISLFTTIFITMGWFESKLRKKRASDQQVATVIKGMYNPPGSTEKKKLFEANLDEEYSAAKDVAHCSQLLRQMYTLDLRIWGMEDCSAAEIPQREELKDRANALFEEIREMVQSWQTPGGLGSAWTVEERVLVDEVNTAVRRYPAERYELGTRAAARRR